MTSVLWIGIVFMLSQIRKMLGKLYLFTFIYTSARLHSLKYLSCQSLWLKYIRIRLRIHQNDVVPTETGSTTLEMTPQQELWVLI